MKKFLKGVIIFSLPVLITGICFEILLRNIPNDYEYKKNYLDNRSRGIKILFLGNSHTVFGVNPEYIGSTGFNAAHISQTLFYDLGILKKYDDKWDSLRYIVLPVDYFSLYSKLEKSIEDWRVKNYTIYYGISSTYHIADHTEILSNKIYPNAARAYNYYVKDISGITCSKWGWGTNYNSKDNQDLVATGIKAAKRHTIKSDEYFNENVEYLRSILEFAKAKNIKVLLFTSPAYKTYVQHLDTAQLTRSVNMAAGLAGSYPNAVYFNLLNDTAFTESDFHDSDHLNEIGAKKLTLKIDSLLRITGRNISQRTY